MTARFAVGASTHPGMIRRENEDNYAAIDGLFVVADGMGGHSAGEVASELAVSTMVEAHQAGIADADGLATAVQRANAEIRRQAAGERAGMGTTLTGIVVLRPEVDGRTFLAIANVGDSRTYLWRDRRLRSITIDHSYVQDLVTGGQITEQEARLHPRRNIVTRALGIDPAVRVDTWQMPAVRGDRFVVCSDGLVDEVPDHEIAALIDGVADPQEAAEHLVAMANRHGGRDNVTVIVVDVLEGSEAPDDGLPEPVWAEGLPEAGLWADTHDDHRTSRSGEFVERDRTDRLPAPTGTALGSGIAHPPPGARARSRTVKQVKPSFGLPQLAFLFALGVIVMVVVVVVALAVRSDPEPSTPTTPSTTPSTAPTTATTPATSTTVGSASTTSTPRRTTTSAPATTTPRTTTTRP